MNASVLQPGTVPDNKLYEQVFKMIHFNDVVGLRSLLENSNSRNNSLLDDID